MRKQVIGIFGAHTDRGIEFAKECKKQYPEAELIAFVPKRYLETEDDTTKTKVTEVNRIDYPFQRLMGKTVEESVVVTIHYRDWPLEVDTKILDLFVEEGIIMVCMPRGLDSSSLENIVFSLQFLAKNNIYLLDY